MVLPGIKSQFETKLQSYGNKLSQWNILTFQNVSQQIEEKSQQVALLQIMEANKEIVAHTNQLGKDIDQLLERSILYRGNILRQIG